MTSKVLSFQEVTLYSGDVELLRHGEWLNDRIIAFCFGYLGHRVLQQRSEVALVDPGTVLIIRFDDEPQLVREIVQELHIDARKLSFFPVNDVQDIAAPGGTHWSLLVLERGTRSFWHFDSIAGKNFKVAREISSRISEVLGLGEFRVQEHWTPQQKNSFDCGVFVVAIAEWIIRQLIEKQRNVFGEGREFVQAEMKEYFGARYIAQFRNVVRGRIEDIAASGTKSTRK